MLTQSDSKIRVVNVTNLEAMCERVSGMCHRYHVSKVSRSRVHVEYSNPDEYGNESPMTIVFPCYPNTFGANKDNPFVLLECLRVIHDSWNGEGYQAFTSLLDCPILWRSPKDNTWKTQEELKAIVQP